jgi:peptide/nickel transport system ATP-binding protein
MILQAKQPNPHSIEILRMSKLLEIKNLVTNFYTYEGVVKALNKISLDVERGMTFGLVGESGCGKSVLVRSIMGIVPSPGVIEGGQILFHKRHNGSETVVDLLQQNEEYLRGIRGAEISMIFQEPNAALNPILSVGEQVSESFLFHVAEKMCMRVLENLDSTADKTWPVWKSYLRLVYKIGSKNAKATSLQLLKKIPILSRWDIRLKQEAMRRSIDIIHKLHVRDPEQVIKSYPHNLSGGMKQRVVIAIALACGPELLIADEATSNLDVTVQAQILELLNELKKDTLSSIMLITHDLGVVAETCERVGVMYAGNLCEIADVEDIFKNPQHPYTKALLKSVPRYSTEGKLESIEGTVPNLVNPPSGCRFHPRCPLVMDQCKQTVPELHTNSKNHSVACYAVNPS